MSLVPSQSTLTDEELREMAAPGFRPTRDDDTMAEMAAELLCARAKLRRLNHTLELWETSRQSHHRSNPYGIMEGIYGFIIADVQNCLKERSDGKD